MGNTAKPEAPTERPRILEVTVRLLNADRTPVLDNNGDPTLRDIHEVPVPDTFGLVGLRKDITDLVHSPR